MPLRATTRNPSEFCYRDHGSRSPSVGGWLQVPARGLSPVRRGALRLADLRRQSKSHAEKYGQRLCCPGRRIFICCGRAATRLDLAGPAVVSCLCNFCSLIALFLVPSGLGSIFKNRGNSAAAVPNLAWLVQCDSIRRTDALGQRQFTDGFRGKAWTPAHWLCRGHFS